MKRRYCQNWIYIAAIVSLFFVPIISIIKGFYNDASNVSGVWVEIHGVVIEFLLITVIFSWYKNRVDETNKILSMSYTYYKTHEMFISCKNANNIEYFLEKNATRIVSRDQMTSERKEIIAMGRSKINNNYLYIMQFFLQGKPLFFKKP